MESNITDSWDTTGKVTAPRERTLNQMDRHRAGGNNKPAMRWRDKNRDAPPARGYAVLSIRINVLAVAD
jgi:hypothetical protein